MNNKWIIFLVFFTFIGCFLPNKVSAASPGNGMVTVEYAATISSAVPAGTYRTNLTYVATPTF